tara:strand:+ start:1926 stop:3047 length:1122 start_codon:yes stop_codon:yes gene_type:complete
MANWKKVIVSGSQAELAGISASALTTLPGAAGEFQVLVTGSGGAFFVTGSGALGGSGGTTTADLIDGAGIQDFAFNGSVQKSVIFDSSSMAGPGLTAGPESGLSASLASDGGLTFNGSNEIAISSSVGTLEVGAYNFTGSFTGSFTGDGSGLTGVTGTTTNESLTFSTGITPTPAGAFNGGTAQSIKVAGADALTNNKVVKWDGSSFVNSTITDDGATVTTTVDLQVDGNATFGNASTDKVTIKGDLVVNGTASFVNQESLQIADKFILLNSGSAPTAGGGIVIGDQGGNKEGALFGLNGDLGTPGNRFQIAKDFDAEDTVFPSATDAFMGLVSASTTTDPNATNATTTIMKEQGNIFISDSESADPEIWIYA